MRFRPGIGATANAVLLPRASARLNKRENARRCHAGGRLLYSRFRRQRGVMLEEAVEFSLGT